MLASFDCSQNCAYTIVVILTIKSRDAYDSRGQGGWCVSSLHLSIGNRFRFGVWVDVSAALSVELRSFLCLFDAGHLFKRRIRTSVDEGAHAFCFASKPQEVTGAFNIRPTQKRLWSDVLGRGNVKHNSRIDLREKICHLLSITDIPCMVGDV